MPGYVILVTFSNAARFKSKAVYKLASFPDYKARWITCFFSPHVFSSNWFREAKTSPNKTCKPLGAKAIKPIFFLRVPTGYLQVPYGFPTGYQNTVFSRMMVERRVFYGFPTGKYGFSSGSLRVKDGVIIFFLIKNHQIPLKVKSLIHFHLVAKLLTQINGEENRNLPFGPQGPN